VGIWLSGRTNAGLPSNHRSFVASEITHAKKHQVLERCFVRFSDNNLFSRVDGEEKERGVTFICVYREW